MTNDQPRGCAKAEPSPGELRRLRREARAVEIVRSMKGNRTRLKAEVPEPIVEIEVTAPGPDELVYFLYSAGLIKIGYTGNLLKRIAEIKSMGGAHAELIAIIPGNREFEKTLHRTFKSDRKHGEWFYLSAEIRRFLGCLDDAVGLLMQEALVAGSCVDRLARAEAAPPVAL